MADAVTADLLADEGLQVIYHLTNTSDGTGQAAVKTVDVSALQGAPAAVAIRRIRWSTAGMAVKLLWDASTDQVAWDMPADTSDDITFEPPLRNPAASGATGDIMVTTTGHTSSDTYVIHLELLKTPLT